MQDLKELYKRFLNRKCSPEEVTLLLEHFRLGRNDETLSALIREELENAPPDAPDMPEVSAILERNRGVIAEISEKDSIIRMFPPKRRTIVWYAAASLTAACCLLGYYFYQLDSSSSPRELVQLSQDATQGTDRAPGNDRAILTLSDGSTITLDDAGEGQLAEQAGVALVKTGAGQLNYRAAEHPPANPVPVYNTISVPRGGEFKVTLPDGTRVWLNAESSLRYPVSFSQTTREVELRGEGYFEVAHREDQPFIVKSKGQEVKVLGTHFNVKAYENEPYSHTTLIEGSVHVRQLATGKQQLLRPGEQARLNKDSFEVIEASLEESIAWKNELFVFRNTDIHSVMKQLERWYDVELAAGDLPEKRFYGEISRNVKLSEILEMMELTSGLKFKIEGRRIMLQ